jgi:hypothetical protein
MTAIDTRLGTRGDLHDFVALLEDAETWMAARGIRQWAPGSNRAEVAVLSQQLSRRTLVLAYAERALIGGCSLTRLPTDVWPDHRADAAYLSRFVVARPHAGLGVSALIIATCSRGHAPKACEAFDSTAGMGMRIYVPSTAGWASRKVMPFPSMTGSFACSSYTCATTGSDVEREPRASPAKRRSGRASQGAAAPSRDTPSDDYGQRTRTSSGCAGGGPTASALGLPD